MTMSNALWKLIQRFLDDKNGMPVLNPATGEQMAAVKTYSTAEIEDIILRADNARKDWVALTAKVRAERLRDWYFQVLSNGSLRKLSAPMAKPFRQLREVKPC